MKVLYFDCFSGAAGDMILAALVDAGASESAVRESLGQLEVSGWDLSFETVDRHGLRALRAVVRAEEQRAHRTIHDVEAILRGADLPQGVEARALRTFDLLAKAEAKVHGLARDDVHFHEVGALDAIVDVVGACAALEYLAPDRVVTSPIATGRGETTSEHGIIPVPGPATIELLHGATVYERGRAELVTPTGAAILAAATDEYGALPMMQLEGVGYGAGTRDTEVPNVLRVLLGTAEVGERRQGLLIETNIDDMTPEMAAHALERLLAAGAQDAWLVPNLMKKGRPGWTLSALTDRARADEVLSVLYRETTTLGARLTEVAKDELERTSLEVGVDGHPVRVKIGSREGVILNLAPEYDDAVKTAAATGAGLPEIYSRATQAARALLESQRDGGTSS